MDEGKDPETHEPGDEISRRVIGAAIEVHRELGPGLLESAYEGCLCYELTQLGLSVGRQVPLSVKYKTVQLDCAYRLDLLVDEQLIVEIKSVAQLEPIHEAQLLTYLRLANKPLGLLLNFNVTTLRQGIRRMALTRKRR